MLPDKSHSHPNLVVKECANYYDDNCVCGVELAEKEVPEFWT